MKDILRLIFVLSTISSSLSQEHPPFPAVELVDALSNLLKTECIEVIYSEKTRHQFYNRMYDVFKSMSMMGMTTLYSVQNYGVRKVYEERWSSSTCKRPIRILVGRKQSMASYGEMTRILTPAIAPVTLIAMFMPIDVFFRNATPPVNLVTIAAQYRTLEFIELYDVYKVDDDSPLKMQLVGNWTRDEGVQLNLTRYHHLGRKFDGKVFRTVSPEIWPYVTFHGFMDENVTWDGLYPRVWRELQSLLNFTSVHYRHVIYGALDMQDNKWSGMIRMAVDRKVDVVVADLTLASNRIKVLDFINVLPATQFRTYYKQIGKQVSWFAVFLPLNADVWAAVLMIYLALSVCYYVTVRIQNAFGVSKSWEPLHYHNYFFLTVQAVAQQGNATRHDTLSSKILFLAEYSATAIVYVAYTACFVSFLSQETPKKPFNSIQDLLEDGSYKLLIRQDSAQREYFLLTEGKTQKNLDRILVPFNQTYYRNNTSTGLGMICSNNKMVLFEKEQMMSMMNPAGLGCELLSVDQPRRMIYDGIAVRRGSPYALFFRFHVQKMREAGLIHRMFKKFQIKKEEMEMTVKPIGIQQVVVIFVSLAFGMILSLVFLLMEMLRCSIMSRLGKHCRERRRRGGHGKRKN